jgi:hypothetical protein
VICTSNAGVEQWHYVLINNLDRFMNVNKAHGKTDVQIRQKWCTRCIRAFNSEKSLDKHMQLCLHFLKFGPCTYELSTYNTIEFRDWQKLVIPSYIVYADFECVLQTQTAQISPANQLLQKHVPSMAAYLLVPIQHDKESLLPMDYKVFYGPNCISDFLVSLSNLAVEVGEWYNNFANVPIIDLTSSQQEDFDKAEICYLCRNKLYRDRVRDHDHVTGKYLGAAHTKCNLNRKQVKHLPVLFHNLRKYDMHFIIKYACGVMSEWELNPIAQNAETFLALTCRLPNKTASQIRFLDSLQFLQSSLDNLTKMMSPQDFVLSRQLPQWEGTMMKQVFPYSYITDFNILDEYRTSLPAYDDFYDVLRCKVVLTREEYNVACNKYETWGCTTLREYLHVYLKIDVYLLADCFQYFRKLALEDEGLEPTHFFSIPGMSWSSALKRTQCKLDVLKDSQMYEAFEIAIRGGLSFVNKHQSEYKEGEVELLYVDVNNLYGWALSEPLPYADFQWVDDEDRLKQLVEMLPSMDCVAASEGYLFEVDIEIPQQYHDFMEQLPVCPEHMIPPPQLYGEQHGVENKVEKLVTSLLPKRNYYIHFRLLQQVMALGGEVTHIHRAISFKQARIFKPYIDYNTEKRSQSTNSFNKNLYKLKNNSLYGKTCENVRKRINLKICNNDDTFVKFTSKLTFRKTIEIAEDLVLALLRKGKIYLDKPIYIGQAVLDLSKFIMYDLHYNKLKSYERKFGCTIDIMGGDTDSFFLECRNVSLRNQLLPAMIEDKLLDSSNYAKDDPLYDNLLQNWMHQGRGSWFNI